MPTYFKLIYELLLKEASIINEYKKKQSGLIGSGNRRTTKIYGEYHCKNWGNSKYA